MRAIILSAWAVSACTVNINHYAADTAVINPAVSIASDWVGSHQSHDRSRLQEFIGVDPVRTEWCAAFVNSVLEGAGIPGSESVHRYPLLARSFLTWGEGVSREDIQSGDVVIFPRGREGWQGHVGFYVGTVWEADVEYWAILGGNQQNSVSVDLYPADRAISIRRWAEE